MSIIGFESRQGTEVLPICSIEYELANKANQNPKTYATLKELYINDFIDSIIEEEKTNVWLWK